jgi:hypothetical protein
MTTAPDQPPQPQAPGGWNPVATCPGYADMFRYVNLSVTGPSPTVITVGPAGVLTPHVTTRLPLPRAELQHAPAPAEPQDDELYTSGGTR